MCTSNSWASWCWQIYYLVQDSFSFWVWPWFILLVFIGSFFTANLALAVISMAFGEAKQAQQREIDESMRSTDLVTRSQMVFHGSHEENEEQGTHTVLRSRSSDRRASPESSASDATPGLIPSPVVLVPGLSLKSERRTTLGVDVRDGIGEEEQVEASVCVGIRRFVDDPAFGHGIIAVILLNTIMLGVEHHNQPAALHDVVHYTNLVFTGIFTIEMILKVMSYGPGGYAADNMNLFDAAIVMVSLLEIAGVGSSSVSVLRTCRLLRILKLLHFFPTVQRQVTVLFHTLGSMMSFISLVLLFCFIYAVMGMQLFGGKFMPPEPGGEKPRINFDSLFWAFVTVFQVLTLGDWALVMAEACTQH